MPIQKYFREPFPGISHFVGAILSAIALGVLLVLAHGRFWYIVAFSIYGVSSIVLYLASGFAHSLPCDKGLEEILDRTDRAAIFGLIAGTYTPVCMLRIQQPWGWVMLGVEWGLAILGILAIAFNIPRQRWVRTSLYVVMAWLAMAVMVPLRHSLPTEALEWIFAGGAIYTIGALVFATNWPDPWPPKFVAHDLWHVMVIAGSACFFVLIARYVA